jgi:hypothetical protein
LSGRNHRRRCRRSRRHGRRRDRTRELEPGRLCGSLLRSFFSLDFGFFRRFGGGFRGNLRSGQVPKMLAHFLGDRYVDGAGMSLLFRDAGF